MRVEPCQLSLGGEVMRRVHDGMAPAIRAEQAKFWRGTRIHSLGVPAVTTDMSGARLNVESGRPRSPRPHVV